MDSIFSALPAVGVAGVILLLIVGFGVMVSRLYTRATKDLAFVRTGFRGETVVVDGGSLVMPVIHSVTYVSMATQRLVVSRTKQASLITKDRLRVDVEAEFFVRVGKNAASISNAATTLGSKTTNSVELLRFAEGKFVDALRSVAASMDMAELHQQRKIFVASVQEAVQLDLEKNGLELESVSLTGLDQTSREYFNESNAFDAEGLTKLTQEIESRRKQRNDIEQNTRIDIERKKTEADQLSYTIAQENAIAKAAQQKAIDENQAKTAAEVAVTVAEQQRLSEAADIARARAIEVANIEKARDLALSEQDKKIKIAEKTEAEAAATAKANAAKAEAVKAEELVETARRTEVANREKNVAVIAAQQAAEQQAVGVRVAAETEKQAAEDRAEAIRVQAQAEKERDELRAEGALAIGQSEAEALKLRNAAENSLSQDAASLRVRMALAGELRGMIEATVKPLEKIDSIRIVDLDGFNPGAASGHGGNSDGASSTDRLVGAALSHRVNAPIVDKILAEVGLVGGLASMVSGGGLEALLPTASVKVAESVSEISLKPEKTKA
jgi:uncharacterized membrane protein YqiK